VSPKILYAAPVKDFSGYASASRDYVTALDKSGANLATRALRYDGGDHVPSDRFAELENRNLKDVEIIVQQTTPNEMEFKVGKFNVGIFCWETDKIPDLWVNQLNKMNLVLVPCEDNLRTIRKCGVIVPVEKIHYACDVEKYGAERKPFMLPGADSYFKFLSVFQFSKKKSLEVLLKSYLSEFSPEDPVCLIVKTYMTPMDGPEQKQRIQQLIQAVKELLRIKKYPRIHLIHDVLSHEAIERLYATADCYVLPSRGEGWGVPHFDALGYGLPTIATRGTGPEEFITDDCGWLVDSHMSPVVDMPHPHDFLYTGKENWHEPHACHLKECMREAFSMWSKRDQFPAWDKKCEAARNRVQDFSHDVIGPRLLDTIMKYYGMWKVNEESRAKTN
jgi:glycosyltransferase involved in cell wall biosynthesis